MSWFKNFNVTFLRKIFPKSASLSQLLIDFWKKKDKKKILPYPLFFYEMGLGVLHGKEPENKEKEEEARGIKSTSRWRNGFKLFWLGAKLNKEEKSRRKRWISIGSPCRNLIGKKMEGREQVTESFKEKKQIPSLLYFSAGDE